MFASCYSSAGLVSLFIMHLFSVLFFHDTEQVYLVNIQGIISQGPEVLEKKPSRELTVHIDRLAYIFRFD